MILAKMEFIIKISEQTRMYEKEVRVLNLVLRQEHKYVITRTDFIAMAARLQQVMLSDEHNGALGYTVRSLYFDTPNDADYMNKLDGLELRQKVRLRSYSTDADFAMLELKQKQGALQKKRSLRLSCNDAQRLIATDYSVLLGYSDPFAAEMYALMANNIYRPKTVVEYNRKAFIAKENRIRITFDNTLRATESCFNLFDDSLAMNPIMDDFNVVLEVKFNGFLLGYIKSLLNMSDRSPLSVSKYCLARQGTMQK